MRPYIAPIVAVCLLISSCSVKNNNLEDPLSRTVTPPTVKVDYQPEFIIDKISIDTYVPPIISMKDLNCLTKGIYYEAGAESTKGKEAVGFVILNRSKNGKFPPSVCGVVKQVTLSAGKKSCQFSWYCSGGEKKLNAIITTEQYKESERIALSILNGRIDNWIPKAISFHMSGVNAGWTKKGMNRIAQIGNHIFYSYREKG